MSASVLSATRVILERLHLGYRELKGFFRRSYQAIPNIPYELHFPFLSLSTSADKYEILDTNTDKASSASQQFPVNDASSSTANDSDPPSKNANDGNATLEQSPVSDDTDQLKFTSQDCTIIPNIKTDQGSSVTTFGSSTFGSNTHEANSTGEHESSSLSTVANEDKLSPRHELNPLDDLEGNAASAESTPTTIAGHPSLLDRAGETSSS